MGASDWPFGRWIRGAARILRRSIDVRAWPLLLFLPLYVLTGLLLARTGVFERWAVLFGSDSPRVSKDLVVLGAAGERTAVHPLFVLLFNPIGVGLSRLLPRSIALVLLVSATGTAAVLATETVLRRNGIRHPVLFAAVFGASTSTWIFSSFPETGIFSSLSLILLVLAISARSTAGSIAASVFTTGMVLTNGVVAAIGVAGSLPRRRIPFVAFSVAASLVVLILVEFAIYPKTIFRFRKADPASTYEDALLQEADYSKIPGSGVEFAGRVGSVALHFLVHDFVPGRLRLGRTDGPVLHFDRSFPPLGWLAVALWAFLLALAARSSGGRGHPLVRPLALGLGFQFAMHLFYGREQELFLYSSNWVFLVLASFAIRFDRHRSATALLSGFLVLELLGGGVFVSELLGEIARVGR